MLVKFDLVDGPHGPAITIDGIQITRGCSSPAEVKCVVSEVMADLNRVAVLMKQRTTSFGSESPFDA